MSIQLNLPIKINLNEIEIDDYLPSIKFQFDIQIEQYGHFSACKGDIWVDSRTWDSFCAGLKNDQTTQLNDMDTDFIINIIHVDGTIEFSWSFKNINSKDQTMAINFNGEIDQDIYNHIKSAFIDYPKWW